MLTPVTRSNDIDPIPLTLFSILLKFNTTLNKRRLKSNMWFSNWRKDSEDSKSDWSFWLFCASLWNPMSSTARRFWDGCPVFQRIDGCLYPVAQDPSGSFEFGAVHHRRDNFNICFCFDVSKFQVAGLNIVTCIYIYGCPRRNVVDFGRAFLMYSDKTQKTYIQSWTVTEIVTREVGNFDSCYTRIDYQIHIKTGRNMWFL